MNWNPPSSSSSSAAAPRRSWLRNQRVLVALWAALGLVALVLEAVALGSSYWAKNDASLPALRFHAGLWVACTTRCVALKPRSDAPLGSHWGQLIAVRALVITTLVTLLIGLLGKTFAGVRDKRASTGLLGSLLTLDAASTLFTIIALVVYTDLLGDAFASIPGVHAGVGVGLHVGAMVFAFLSLLPGAIAVSDASKAAGPGTLPTYYQQVGGLGVSSAGMASAHPIMT